MSIRVIGGWLLLVIGLFGTLLPIIPGIPIMAAGVAMLGSDHWLVQSGRGWLRSRGILR